MNWTDAQRRAIQTTGCDLLVSAGAGSGKTAVLAERCAHLVADARPACGIDRLLVVTFTEAAAEEMRSRIGRALRERLGRRPDDRWLREQLVRLDLASISTIHAFCRRTLEKHFAAAGLDPGFAVLDEHEAATLRDEAAHALFAELAVGEDATAHAYDELRHLYGAGQDERIRELVVGLSEFLGSLPDPEVWNARMRARYAGLSADALPEEWRLMRRELLVREIGEAHDALERTIQRFAATPAAADWVAWAQRLAEQTEEWLARLGSDAVASAEMDELCRGIVAMEFEAIPRRTAKIKSLPPDQLAAFDVAKGEVEAARKAIRSLAKCDARYSESDWAEGLRRVAPHVALLLELVQRFDLRFSESKRAISALDFGDLERRTLDLLRGSPETVAWLRARYEHVLVDEFQDINPLQAELLRCVSRADDPAAVNNFFCVGDAKQSIYRFRLAEPELFIQRQNEFSDLPPAAKRHRESPGTGHRALRTDAPNPQSAIRNPQSPSGLRVDLPENFRSQPAVLDAVNRLMTRLMTAELGGVDYDDRTRLRPGPRPDMLAPELPAVELHLVDKTASTGDEQADDSGDEADEPSGDAPPDQLELEAVEREAVIAANRILSLRREHPQTAWRDIVILVRSLRNHGTQVVRMLAQMGIPAICDRAGGLFAAVEVRDMLALLALLDNAQQDIPLATILRSPLCAAMSVTGPTLPLSQRDLAAIRIHRPAGPFHRAAAAYADSGEDARLRGILRDLIARLERWRGMARRETASDLIARLYAETDYPACVAATPDGAQRRANLEALHERARQFSGFSRQGLSRFLQFLADLQDRDEDLSAGAPPAAAEDVVRLMSIHKAKGLEFLYVFLLRSGARFNFTDLRDPLIFDRKAGLGLRAVDAQRRISYPTLAHRVAAERLRAETHSEELRLLYVALTRAKRRIFIVGTAAKSDFDLLDRPVPLPPGPLPVSQRRSAAGMLDWIIAALAAEPAGSVSAASSDVPDTLFTVERHAPPDPSDVIREAARDAGRTAIRGAAAQLAALPLPQGLVRPEHAVEARAILDRLGRVYAAQPLTAVPSVVAVSELKRRWVVVDDPEAPAFHAPAPTPQRTPKMSEWRRPRFAALGTVEAARAAEPAPTDRGTWTHLLLQHLDLAGPCDAADLCRQRERLVDSGRLHADEAAVIDVDALAWFFAEPAGQELRRCATTLRRETPFVLAVEPTRYDSAATPLGPDDFLVVRGIIDVLYERPDGIVVLDWKTDAGSGAVIDERIATYAPQLDIYARAVRELFGRPVTARRLAFLNARRIVDV